MGFGQASGSDMIARFQDVAWCAAATFTAAFDRDCVVRVAKDGVANQQRMIRIIIICREDLTIRSGLMFVAAFKAGPVMALRPEHVEHLPFSA